MGVITWDQAVDIGGGRGRLAPAAAASLARVDRDMRSAFGRAADINEAWRSPADADENYRKYLRYLSGGPWAPIALPGDKSVHCFGEAVDTDDTSDAQMRIWNDHGWYWTVYRDGKLVERWHLEYFANRDNHRNEGASASTGDAATFNQSEEDDMSTILLRIDGGTSYTIEPFRGIKAHANVMGARLALRGRNKAWPPPEGPDFERFRSDERNGELQCSRQHAQWLADVYGVAELLPFPAPGEKKQF